MTAARCIRSILALGVVACGSSSLWGALLDNESFKNITGTGQHMVSIVVAGNQPETNFSAFTNPFLGGSTSVTYDPRTGNTTIAFQDAQGGRGIADGVSANVGYNYTGPGALETIEKYWGAFNTSSFKDMPAIALSNLTGGGANTRFLSVYVTLSMPGFNNVMGEWVEMPIPGDVGPQAVFENDSTAGFTLSQAGFMLSPTMIPLDQLNNDFEPPINYQPLPGIPDGTSLNPGSFSDATAPEPSTVVLFALGLAALVGAKFWRRRAN
jgi:hypothetical protein